MDNAYARIKLTEIYTRIPTSSIRNSDVAALIHSELSQLIAANPTLKYEFTVRSEIKPDTSHFSKTDLAFCNVRTIMEEPATTRLSNDIPLYPLTLGNDLHVVVKQLLHSLSFATRERTTPKAKKRGARVLYRGKNVYEYKKQEYPQKNCTYARLCGFVYDNCRLVGSKIAVIEVYKFMRPNSDYMVETNKNWKWLYDTTEAANRWAKGEELPKLMRCETDFIVRLGKE